MDQKADHPFATAYADDSALGPLCTCGLPLSQHDPADVFEAAASMPGPTLDGNGRPLEPSPSGELLVPAAAARLAPVLGDARRLDRLEAVLVAILRSETHPVGRNPDLTELIEGLVDDVDRRAAALNRFRAGGLLADRVRGGVAKPGSSWHE